MRECIGNCIGFPPAWLSVGGEQGGIIKTTIDISDPLLEEVRRVAASRGVTVRSLVEQGLRKVLAERASATPFRLRKASVSGRGLNEQWQAAGWDRIRDASYGVKAR